MGGTLKITMINCEIKTLAIRFDDFRHAVRFTPIHFDNPFNEIKEE
jgi:hypothetical protein